MIKPRQSALLAALVIGCLAGAAATVRAADTDSAKDPKVSKYIVGDKESGYVFATPETRAMEDDDFQNPGFLWVDQGEKLWSKVDGAAGKSCASCHGDATKSMKGVAAHFPKFNKKAGKIVVLEEQINNCRKNAMQAQPWKWESDPLLAMTAYLTLQSRGMPVDVKVDGPAKPFFEKGKQFYFQRRGSLDMACANCHVDNPGRHLRSEILSQGQINGFPTYRLKWQKLGSAQRRFKGCNKQVGAQPYELGSDEYDNLQLYMAWRANGLPVEGPDVRK